MVLAFFFFCSYKGVPCWYWLFFFFVLKREFPVGPGFFFFVFCSYKGVPCWSWLFFFFVLIREFPDGIGFIFFFLFL